MEKHAVMIRIPEDYYNILKYSAERINVPVASYILLVLQPVLDKNKEYFSSADFIITNEKRD